MRVIDISYAQGTFNWDAAAAAVRAKTLDGVIIRCGYGSDISSQDDIQFGRNVYEAERRGIPYGLYLYSYARDDASNRSEAAHVIRLAKNRQPVIGVYLDLEENSLGYNAKAAARTFCKALTEKRYRTGIYCGAYYYKAYLQGVHEEIKDIWWWIAGYGSNSGAPEYHYKPQPGFSYDGWQYTSVYRMAGWNSGLDASEWYTKWKDAGQTPSKPVTAGTDISYRAHCQTYGWLPAVKNGQIAGTVGQSKRLEAIKIAPPDGLELEVEIHMQDKGWKKYTGIKRIVRNGHVLSSGTESSDNDPIMGSVGQSRRLEAIRIRATKNTTGKKLKYQAHVQNIGWQKAVGEGEIAGTTGKALRMEALKIWLE